MRIEQSVVTKLLISEAPNLDPITAFLDHFEPGKGKITVNCLDKSWTANWGGMSDDVATFCRTTGERISVCRCLRCTPQHSSNPRP